MSIICLNTGFHTFSRLTGCLTVHLLNGETNITKSQSKCHWLWASLTACYPNALTGLINSTLGQIQSKTFVELWKVRALADEKGLYACDDVDCD